MSRSAHGSASPASLFADAEQADSNSKDDEKVPEAQSQDAPQSEEPTLTEAESQPEVIGLARSPCLNLSHQTKTLTKTLIGGEST